MFWFWLIPGSHIINYNIRIIPQIDIFTICTVSCATSLVFLCSVVARISIRYIRRNYLF